MTLMNDQSTATLIGLAKSEDLGSGDLSAALLPHPDKPAELRLLAKQVGVVAGQEIAQTILQAYDPSIEIRWNPSHPDGSLLDRTPVELATIRGALGAVLSAERVLLNFLQRLSGIASLTRQYVEAIDGTSAEVYDTRKTTPGWRSLEKYAVRCGGGRNHRQGLYDAVLIKDNHLADVATEDLAASLSRMLNRLGCAIVKPSFIEVEVDTPAQFEQVLKVVGIDLVLLDNFSLDDSRRP